MNHSVEIKEHINKMKEQVFREAFLNDDVIDMFQQNMIPMESLMTYYRCALMEVETKFKVLNEQFSIQYDKNPIESIKTRIKSMNSIIKKMNKKNIELSLEAMEQSIFDIAGIRVICSFPEDIYLLADSILRQDDVKLIEKKDYIQNPKPNGYRSLHLIIEIPIFLETEKRFMKVEIQLRTIAMDFWASLEHKLRYKKDIPEELNTQLTAELEECANISSALDYRMETIRDRISQVKA